MKLSHIIASVSAATLLTACGGASTDGSLQDGEYAQSITVTNVDFPGMDDSMRDQIKAQMQQQAGAQMGENICIDGRNGSLDWKELSKGMAQGIGGQCEETKNEGTETTVSLAMTCQIPGAGEGKITLEGAAEADSFSADLNMKMDMPNSEELANIDMKMDVKRVGECS